MLEIKFKQLLSPSFRKFKNFFLIFHTYFYYYFQKIYFYCDFIFSGFIYFFCSKKFMTDR